MNKIFMLLILLCFFTNLSFSQEVQRIDSLFAALKIQKKDTAKVKTLNALALEFVNNDPDTAMYFGNEALQLATKLNYKMGIAEAYLWMGYARMNLGQYDDALKFSNRAFKIYDQLLTSENIVDKALINKQKARAYNNIGMIYWFQGNYPEALNNYFASLEIRKEINDKKGIAGCYNNIGLVFSDQGNYTEALKNYFAALKISEELGNKLIIAASNNNIARIYKSQNRYPEALKNFFATLKIQKELEDKRGIASSLNNIGSIYDDQDNYPEALKNFFASLKIREELGDKQGIAQSYNNIGLVYLNQKKYSKAFPNLFASLKIKEEIGDDRGIAESYNNIGNVYRFQNNYKEAYLYLDKSLMLAKEIGDMEKIKFSYHSMASLDSTQGNFKKSLEHYKLYITFRDSLENNEISEKLTQQQLQYDFDKKEAIAKSEQQKKDAIIQEQFQQQKIIRNSFIAGSILLIFLIVVLINRNKLKRTVEMEKMRSRLSRDLHDDIGSTLSSINILSRTAQSNLYQSGNEKTKASLEKINERSQRLLDNISDIIWNINPGNDTIEEVMSRMREYATTILEAKNIDYTFNFPKEKMDCKLSMEVKNNMYLIFKEAVNNLSKYSGASKANLSLTFDEKNIHLKVEDNGNGFNEMEIKHRGGLSNMQHRAEEIKGVIKISSVIKKGTVLELSMPRYC